MNAVAFVKGLPLANNIVAQKIIKLEKSPQDATSSMHRDLFARYKTEFKSLREYVIKEDLKCNVETPIYQKILEKLS